jgi:hypothetical protein
MQQGEFALGGLVSVRGRKWIVVTNGANLTQLKPIKGSEPETKALYLPLEQQNVRPAEFASPNPKIVGDPTGSLALFETSRLLLRGSAAPLRSAGHFAFVPCPYE